MLGLLGQRDECGFEEVAEAAGHPVRLACLLHGQLPHEERVSLGAGQHRPHHRPWGLLPHQCAELPGHLVLGEADQVEAIDMVAAAGLREQGGQVSLQRRARLPLGAHQRDALAGESLGQHAEQGEGRGVRPVEVLHHHQHRRRIGQPTQEPAHTVEEPGLGARAHRGHRFPGDERLHLGHDRAQHSGGQGSQLLEALDAQLLC